MTMAKANGVSGFLTVAGVAYQPTGIEDVDVFCLDRADSRCDGRIDGRGMLCVCRHLRPTIDASENGRGVGDSGWMFRVRRSRHMGNFDVAGFLDRALTDFHRAQDTVGTANRQP